MSIARKQSKPREWSPEASTAKALQSMHPLVSKLERSKESAEEILDNLPEIFVVCDQFGTIHRGNFEAAKFLNVDSKDILGKNILGNFDQESTHIFQQYLKEVGDEYDSKNFELPYVGAKGEKREIVWTIQEFTQVSRRRGKMIKIAGRDLTEVRRLEKKLSSIFSAIPLGIVTCNAEGQVEHPYSAYTEILLDQKGIEGRDIVDVVFGRSTVHLNSTEKMGLSQIVGSLGEDSMWFDMSKQYFPNQIQLSVKNNDVESTRYLGVSYHPILKDDLVSKIMIIINDRTDIVEEEKAAALQQRVESGRMAKILEVQNCTGKLLEVTFQDLDDLVPKLKHCLENNTLKEAANTLHAIKGVVRTAGFTEMMNLSHDMEDEILNKKKPNIKGLLEDYKILEGDWKGTKNLCYALSGKSHEVPVERRSMEKITQKLEELKSTLKKDQKKTVTSILKDLGVDTLKDRESLDGIAERIRLQEEKLKSMMDKNFEVDIDFGKTTIACQDRSKFIEIFLHLFTNACDHGIESPEVRKKKRKRKSAQITIKSRKRGRYTTFEISDDGGGIDATKVKAKAVKLEIMSKAEAKALSPEDTFQLLLKPAFSTKDEADEISGRGIGLDAVNEAVRALGSKGIKITSTKGKGTSFTFSLPM